MAIVQLTCPETGKPVDILEVPAGAFQSAVLSSPEIPCPHCGKNHLWASGDLGLAMRALHDSPEASRVLDEAGSATAPLWSNARLSQRSRVTPERSVCASQSAYLNSGHGA